LELSLRLLLVALLLDSPAHWYFRVPVVLVAAAGLLVPGALRSRWLFAGLTLLTALPLFAGWPFSDNHDYLRCLLCLAAATCLCAPEPRRALAWNARMLVGLLFAFAALWKGVLAPDFVDGRFFRVTLLTDSRFHDLTVLAGAATPAVLAAYDEIVRMVLSGGSVGSGWPPPGFQVPVVLGRLATVATVFTLALELAIAVCFLWPSAGRPARLRNALLLVFGAITYAVAPVRGFGWLLCVLGVAQTRRREYRARWAFVALFALIEIYHSVPWSDALVRWLAGG